MTAAAARKGTHTARTSQEAGLEALRETTTMTTRITYTYSDTAPVYGESRAYADLPADAREWWDSILARAQAVADRAAELGAERRDAIIAAGTDGDLEVAVIDQERALAEALS